MSFLNKIFNYDKPGPGVSRNQQPKKRIVLFFEILFRKFTNLIKVNLLFLVFSIPIITIGPSFSAMTYILRNFSLEKPVFLFSDFFDEFKKNFKKSFLFSIISAILIVVLSISGYYYYTMFEVNVLYKVLFCILIFIALILSFSSYYVYPMIVTLELKLFDILKNALRFAFIGLKQNILIMLISLLLVIPVVLFFVFDLFSLVLIYFFLFILIIPALINFVSVFSTYPLIKKYCIDPYYINNQLENPHDKKIDSESIFSDDID